MADLNSFDLPLTELESVLSKWTQEAVEMRYGVAGDPDGKLTSGTDDSPAEAVMYLRRVRQRADRVGELLAAAKRARGRARRALAESAFATDNEVAASIKKQGRAEFQGHREREVEAKLDAFESRRVEHQAKRLVSVADEAVDVISDMHWSLDAIRKDLRSTLHALQFEASLER